MSHAIDERPFPRGVLIAAALLISFAIAVAATARLTGAGASRIAPGAVVEDQLMRLALQSDGSVRAYDVSTGGQIAHLPQQNFGFIGVVLQGIRRERMRANAPADAPVRLTRHSGGHLRIEDTATGHSVGLSAFGHDNEKAFAELFEKGRTAR